MEKLGASTWVYRKNGEALKIACFAVLFMFFWFCG